MKSSSTSSKIIVIGSSSVLARSLADTFDGITFFGRTNPFMLKKWIKIEPLGDSKGIKTAVALLKQELKKLKDVEEAHLVLLQGVSSLRWEESLNVNLVSVAELSEAFASWAEANSISASITIMGSAAAILGGKLQYSSSKAALLGIMHSLAKNYSPGLRANLVLPGVFKGSMVADWNEEKVSKISQKTYSGRFAEPEEIVDSIKFVIGNKYMSGSVINITNGQVSF